MHGPADILGHLDQMVGQSRGTMTERSTPPPSCTILVDKVKKVTPVHAHSSALRRHWWHHEVRPDHHWSHVAGGCIRSTPELSAGGFLPTAAVPVDAMKEDVDDVDRSTPARRGWSAALSRAH